MPTSVPNTAARAPSQAPSLRQKYCVVEWHSRGVELSCLMRVVTLYDLVHKGVYLYLAPTLTSQFCCKTSFF